MSAYFPPVDTGLTPLFVDDTLLIVDKPAGLLSVPGRGEDKADCLVSRIQVQFADALIVHRLDMSTSGLLVLARGEEMHRLLSKLFRDRLVDKRYVAVVDGLLKAEQGEVELPLICDWPNRPRQKVDPLTGRASLTRWQVLGRDATAGTARLALEPVTGRSHQLRVHLLSIGHPIVGDELYAPTPWREAAPRLLLHACRLAFAHPADGTPQVFEDTAPF